MKPVVKLAEYMKPAEYIEILEDRLCACGCGQRTPPARTTRSAVGQIRGRPTRFIAGHSGLHPFREPIPLSNHTNGWHTWLRRDRLNAPTTIDTYERCMRNLERHSGTIRDDLRLTHVQDYLLDNGVSQGTRELTFVSFRLWHRWGALAGLWPLDPSVIEQRFPKARSEIQPALSGDEARSLIAAVSHPIEVRLVYLGLLAGLRLGSMIDVDEAGWRGSVIAVRVKGGWIHRLPAHPMLMERRDEILSEPAGRRALQGACKRLSVHANGQPFTPRWLRRTFGERMAELGVEREVLGAVMGHSTRSITVAHYAPVTWNEMAKAVNSLSY